MTASIVSGADRDETEDVGMEAETSRESSSGEKGTVLVTGGSRGIGLELARRFAADAHPVVLLARDEEKLREARAQVEEAGAPEVGTLSLDLAEPGAVDRIERRLEGVDPPVDVVVNNAGFSTHGRFHESDAHAQAAMVRVMVEAPTALSRRFLEGMVERDRGGLLNVASTAAFQPGPRQAVYFAAKSYLLSFTEAVAHELRGTDLRVSALCPGPTATDFLERSGVDQVRLGADGAISLMEPGRVAAAGYRGWREGRRVVVPGLLNRLGALGARLAPGGVNLRVVDWLQRPA